MKTSQRILEYLDTRGPATIAEIAAVLERTKADIREQVGKLVDLKMVKCLQAEKSNHPGRPAVRFEKPYTMPETVTRNLVTTLAAFADNNASNNQSKDGITGEIIRSILSAYNPSGSSCASRMNQAVEYLGSLGLKTRWIATRQGPKITILRDALSPLLDGAHLPKHFTQEILQEIKKKAVGVSPTA